MNKLLYRTTIFCLITLLPWMLQSQVNINTNPYWKGNIEMMDGSIKSGLIQVPNIAALKNVLFKAETKAKSEEIKREEVSKIHLISDNGNSFFYDNLPIGSIKKNKTSKKKYLLLSQAKNNYVTFYVMSTYKVNNRTGNIEFVGKYIQGKDIPTFSHYMSKREKNDAKMYYMTDQLGGIKKNAEFYFEEDPSLVEKIKNKDLKAKDISEIIETFLASTNDM